MDDDEDEREYSTCASCGKTVFHDVRECPYCHNDPQGEYSVCSNCNRSLPPGVAQCPYCKNFTDDRGVHANQPRIPRIFVIAGWLVVIAFLLPVILALINWLNKK